MDTKLIICIAMMCTTGASYRQNNKLQYGVGVPHCSSNTHQLPKDMYFEQKLNHSDPTNTTSWKQVILIVDFHRRKRNWSSVCMHILLMASIISSYPELWLGYSFFWLKIHYIVCYCRGSTEILHAIQFLDMRDVARNCPIS